MHWVKLTSVKGNPIWVNLERFDKMFLSTEEEYPHDQITVLRATLSAEEEDYCDAEVKEMPEEIIKLASSMIFEDK